MNRMTSHVSRQALCWLAAPMLVGCHPAPAVDQPSNAAAGSNAVAEPLAVNAATDVAVANTVMSLPVQNGAVRCPATLAGGTDAAAGQRLLGKHAATLKLSNALVTMNAVDDVPESLSGMAEIEPENDPDENSDTGIWFAEMSASPTSTLPATLICQYGTIPVGQRVSQAALLLPLPVDRRYDCTVKTPQGKDARPATAECKAE